MTKVAHGEFRQTWKFGEKVRGKYAVIPEPDDRPPNGIALGRAALVAEASAVFGEAELSERLDRLAADVSEAEAGDKRSPRVQCWACDTVSPNGNHMRVAGWHTRVCPLHVSVTEVYCPECFKRWGWGDGEGTGEDE